MPYKINPSPVSISICQMSVDQNKNTYDNTPCIYWNITYKIYIIFLKIKRKYSFTIYCIAIFAYIIPVYDSITFGNSGSTIKSDCGVQCLVRGNFLNHLFFWNQSWLSEIKTFFNTRCYPMQITNSFLSWS